ncbi:hypothetical protein Plhal304r1_c018g0063741 [Plasmopara halstedii]
MRESCRQRDDGRRLKCKLCLQCAMKLSKFTSLMRHMRTCLDVLKTLSTKHCNVFCLPVVAQVS